MALDTNKIEENIQKMLDKLGALTADDKGVTYKQELAKLLISTIKMAEVKSGQEVQVDISTGVGETITGGQLM